jgi:hypothetical protein
MPHQPHATAFDLEECVGLLALPEQRLTDRELARARVIADGSGEQGKGGIARRLRSIRLVGAATG